jgi:hypothetical protein
MVIGAIRLVFNTIPPRFGAINKTTIIGIKIFNHFSPSYQIYWGFLQSFLYI